MIPALIIIALLSWFFLAFRAFASFNLIIIGFSMIIAVLCGGDEFFIELGAPMLITGLIINFITSFKVERSARPRYMLHLFLYGLFSFLKLVMLLTIIAIPFVSFASAMSHDYREMIIVDCMGNDTGRRVVVDTNTMKDSQGNKYTSTYDDLY